MRQADRNCYEFCSYQAKIFSKSLEKLECSSKMFLRRFFYSNFALHLDFCEFYTFSFDEDDCFKAIIEEYGDSTYGKERIDEKVLHYIGYISRYVCYTRGVTSLFFYKVFDIDMLINRYYLLHTQSEEYAIREMLEAQGLTEEIFDQDKALKEVLKKKYLK